MRGARGVTSVSPCVVVTVVVIVVTVAFVVPSGGPGSARRRVWRTHVPTGILARRSAPQHPCGGSCADRRRTGDQGPWPAPRTPGFHGTRTVSVTKCRSPWEVLETL
ncbi:Uncharacterised protein [Mycobacteroides abscessus]|nr:Uncharacterised protein [Mycobacteroides abscessus]